MGIKLFFCHSSQNSLFVIEVGKYLKMSLKEQPFMYEYYQLANESFIDIINKNLAISNAMIIFDSKGTPSDWQKKEINYAVSRNGYSIIIVTLEETKLGDEYNCIKGYQHIKVKDFIIENAKDTAFEIIEIIANTFRGVQHNIMQAEFEDDLPYNPQLFNYEKVILDYFRMKRVMDLKLAKYFSLDEKHRIRFKFTEDEMANIELIKEKTLNGCPSKWIYPTLGNGNIPVNKDIQSIIGKFRSDSARILVDAQKSFTNADEELRYSDELFFREAGPREYHVFPKANNNLRVAILVSGGIAPGINSVIDGIAQRHKIYREKSKYYGLQVIGLKNGFFAFDDYRNSNTRLEPEFTVANVNQGGSMIGTSRMEEIISGPERIEKMNSFITILRNDHIDILYIIGGDGSMRAAHALYSLAKRQKLESPNLREISVVAIPKTMDNDILWVWQSFGFISAVEKAREVIESLATEVKSNPRLCIVQLYGSHSGFVVSHAVLASRVGSCDAALIPEEGFSLKRLFLHMRERIVRRASEGREREVDNIPYGLIVMSETAIPTDARDFFIGTKNDIGLTKDEQNAVIKYLERKESGLGFLGQTEDNLRKAGLKLVSLGLDKLFSNAEEELSAKYGQIAWERLRIFTNEPRHLLRSTPPSTMDIISGNRLATLAVDNAMAGYTDFMISQWLTEFVLVPLKLVTLGRKQIPSDGIFWKSVIAKTGQGSLLDS